jgi:hypothetical protein
VLLVRVIELAYLRTDPPERNAALLLLRSAVHRGQCQPQDGGCSPAVAAQLRNLVQMERTAQVFSPFVGRTTLFI